MNPVVRYGAITGNLTSTQGLYLVIDAAESGTPFLGDTVSYAIFKSSLRFSDR